MPNLQREKGKYGTKSVLCYRIQRACFQTCSPTKELDKRLEMYVDHRRIDITVQYSAYYSDGRVVLIFCLFNCVFMVINN